MEEIFKRLKDLRQLSGNAQISYLNSVKSDLLKDILAYTYDTHKKYKIDEGKLTKFYSGKIGDRQFTSEDWKIFKYTILDHLADIKSAKDEDVKDLCEYLYNFNEESQEFLKMIIAKDLRLGLNVKKIQKVWADFCVVYPYMGCRTYSRKNLEGIIYPAYAQTKMDGSFCNVIVDTTNKSVEYVSRQSKPQKMEGTLDNLFLHIDLPEKYVFTGEALVWDNKTNRPMERKLGNGILRRDDKTQEEKDSIRFICWDCLPYSKFIEKKWNKPYTERFELLCHYFEQVDSPRLNTVNTWVVNNIDEAMAKFQEQYELGEEGIVVKSFNQIWQDGKPAGQVKVKNEVEADLRCYGFDEGTGRFVGMLGALKCKSEDGIITVDVGTGFSDKDRKEFWNNKDKYLDKILTVRYNCVIQDKNTQKWSLYLPRFIEWRDLDKNTANTFDEINQV